MNPRVSKIRLGLVVPSLTEGGGVPAVARFIRDTALRDRHIDLKLISLSTSSGDPESLRLRSPSSWLRGATARSGIWEEHSFVHVGAVLGEVEFQRYKGRKILASVLAGCDLIQVVCGSPAWANAVVGLGKPVAMHVATRARVERRQRDAAPKSLAGWWRRGMTEITDRMDDRALRTVDAIQVMNPWMFEYAKKLNVGRDVNVRYAPPGVDAELFHPSDARDLVSDPYILCVGRLSDPRKNAAMLLESYALIPEVIRDKVRLVLAGSSGPPKEFWERTKELGLLGRVSYIASPKREELVRMYQGASVFALTSDEEGFGVVLLEAMACGVPVVSTRSGGPEGIISDCDDGCLVPLDDSAYMAERISRLLEDLPLNIAMGLEGRRTIEQRYDQRKAGEVFVEMWEEIVANKRLEP